MKIRSTSLILAATLIGRLSFAQTVLPSAAGSTAPDSSAALPPAAASTSSTPLTSAQCESLARDTPASGELFVCINLIDGFQVIHAPPDSLVPPNRGLTVIVKHDTATSVQAELGGTQGITIPSLASPSTDALRARAAPKDGVIDVFRFAPRLAGPAKLTINRKTGQGDYTAAGAVELQVDTRYWGAVRFGLGTIFGKFHGYEARTFAGSQTLQIVDSFTPLQFEFVTGIAVYPEVFWGGRSYAMGGHQNIHLGLLVGFGLLGQSVDKLEGLTSFHGGIEVEFARDFSLALTAVARRQAQLTRGYVSGSPVQQGTVFTDVGVVPALGVVLNASPSFVQFAMGGKGGSR